MTGIAQQTTEHEKSRYIRLATHTLYKVPDCYGNEPDPMSDACIHCFLRKQCREKWEVEWR